MKRFAIGDIHGNPTTLKQCLERSEFNKEEDLLIQLGDVVDSWSGTPEVIEELMTIEKLVLIAGNHDEYFIKYWNTGVALPEWTEQGGQATLDRYKDDIELMQKHIRFLRTAVPYYELDNMLFVHGGVPNIYKDIRDQSIFKITWDRSMYIEACQRAKSAKRKNKPAKPFGKWDKIFIGHTTTTINILTRKHCGYDPKFVVNVINIDTGGGLEGKLTIMNIDTNEYWQSDFAKDTGWGTGR